MKTLQDKLRVTIPKLRAMKIGESRLFTESQNANAGALVTSKASDIGYKVTTERCLVVSPKSTETIKAVIVTRQKG